MIHSVPCVGVTVEELCKVFEAHAETYYRKPVTGRPTGEHVNFRHALRPLREMFGDLPASELTPGRLRQVRDMMVASGLARGTVNQRIGKIRRVWKWAVSYELLPATTLVALQTVEPLKRGRSRARETSGVSPVPEEHVHAVVSVLRRSKQERLAALIEVLLYTGMRVGEARLMRVRDVEIPTPPPSSLSSPLMLRSAAHPSATTCWKYRPTEHKTEHHGKERVVMLGPKSQEVLRPLLSLGLDAYVFHPRHCAGARPYRRDSIRNAVQRACIRAGVPAFTPLQIRHTVATKLRREMSIEAARVTLGHASASTTEIYAELDTSKATDAAMRFG